MPSVDEVLEARVHEIKKCWRKCEIGSHWEITDKDSQIYGVDIDADHLKYSYNIPLLHLLPCEHVNTTCFK